MTALALKQTERRSMIPLAEPNLCGREAEYLAECVRSTFVSTAGPFVTRFQDMVATAAGAPFAVATSAGTTGLHAALLVVGVGPDDLVICPTLTFIASANAIAHTGAMPWLMDVSRDGWTLDADLLAASLQRETRRDGDKLIHADTGRRVSDKLIHADTGRRVAAILPVYTLGIPADMDPIMEVARRYDLPVVVDAAAALGATYKGRMSGDLGAHLTMYSFNGNKTVTSGGGGAVTGHDDALVQQLRHITTTARVGAEYVHDRVGYNYRMTNIEAAVGCAQLENLDLFVSAKRRIARRYNQGFADLPGVLPLPDPSYAESACWFSGLVLDDRLTLRSDQIRSALREAGIDARPFWRPMHLQPPFAECPRTPTTLSDDIWPRVLTLPCSTNLSLDDQDYVISSVRRVLRAG